MGQVTCDTRSYGSKHTQKEKLTVFTGLGSGTLILQALAPLRSQGSLSSYCCKLLWRQNCDSSRGDGPPTGTNSLALRRPSDVLPGPDRRARPQPKRHSSLTDTPGKMKRHKPSEMRHQSTFQSSAQEGGKSCYLWN